ncbi:MAG: glycosyltransferase [Pseudomonadota bacterium]
MGTPVEFTNVRLADPRFEGLIDASDNERARIVARFEAKFQAVMARIYAGAGRDEVFETWRAVSAPDMEETDRRIAAAATSASDAAIVESAAADLDLSACARQDFGPSDPPGKGDCVDLVFCFDANFTGHFGPTLLSVTQNTDRPLRVHLICRGIRPSMVEEYAAVFPNVSFILYDVTQISYGDVKLLAHISLSTMDRLVSPELLGGIDRAVYLDVDILVRGDVGELADFALDGALIAARDSIHAEWNSGRMLVYEVARRYDPEKANRFRAFMFDGGQVEFVSYNAGVLVMDLAGLRADQFSTKAVAWAREFELHDQFILNIYTRENRADLPPSWNHFATQELIDDPNLVHFIGTIKPWTDNRRHPFDLEWLACREAYLKKCAEITSG